MRYSQPLSPTTKKQLLLRCWTQALMPRLLAAWKSLEPRTQDLLFTLESVQNPPTRPVSTFERDELARYFDELSS